MRGVSLEWLVESRAHTTAAAGARGEVPPAVWEEGVVGNRR
jgi:hypothetical protein